jgi:hypothetical protein
LKRYRRVAGRVLERRREHAGGGVEGGDEAQVQREDDRGEAVKIAAPLTSGDFATWPRIRASCWRLGVAFSVCSGFAIAKP